MRKSHRFRYFFPLLAAAVVLGQLSGCGDGRPTRVRVSGQVFVDGKPLVAPQKGYAFVRLVPPDARVATGQLDSQGRFTLTTFDGQDGCVLGKHKVVVMAYEQIGPAACRWLAPKKYSDYLSLIKTVTIDGPTDSLRIDLSWNGAQPLVEQFDTSGDSDPAKVH